MTRMDDFSIDQLMLFVVGALGAMGALCLIIQKSKCKSCCWGCIVRDVDAIVAEERLAVTGHTGHTPRSSLDEMNRKVKKELRLSNEEPEPED